MAHPVMWFEVLGADVGKLRKFYADLFGWPFDVIPQIDYGVVKTGETRGIMGGIGPAYPGTRPWVTFYTRHAAAVRSGGREASRLSSQNRPP